MVLEAVMGPMRLADHLRPEIVFLVSLITSALEGSCRHINTSGLTSEVWHAKGTDSEDKTHYGSRLEATYRIECKL